MSLILNSNQSFGIHQRNQESILNMYKSDNRGSTTTHSRPQHQVETDFMAVATAADQRRFQQFGGGQGMYPGVSYLNSSQQQPSTLHMTDQVQAQHAQIPGQSAQSNEGQTSLNHAKSILSQVLSNMHNQNAQQEEAPDPQTAQYVPHEQPVYNANNGSTGLRQADFMPLQQQQNYSAMPASNQINSSAIYQNHSIGQTAASADQLGRRQVSNKDNRGAPPGISQSQQKPKQHMQGQHPSFGQQAHPNSNQENQQLNNSYDQNAVKRPKSGGKNSKQTQKAQQSNFGNVFAAHSQRIQNDNVDNAQNQQAHDMQTSQYTNANPNDKIKEQFFESLGLPGDLENIQNFNYLPQNATVSQQQLHRNNEQSPSSLMSAHFNNERANMSAPTIQQNDQSYYSKKEILTLTIEIGEGQNDNILIHEGDDPQVLAAAFAAKHNIGDQLRGLLAEQIRQNIQQVQLEQFEKQINQNPDLSNISNSQPTYQQNDTNQSHDAGLQHDVPLVPQQQQHFQSMHAPNEDGSLSYHQFSNDGALGYGTFQPSQIHSATHQQQVQGNNNTVLNVPFSDNYRSWQVEMNKNLKNGGTASDMREMPVISQGSRQIMEQKKYLAQVQGSGYYNGPVHERLYRGAVQRQQSAGQPPKRASSHRGPNPNSSFERPEVHELNTSAQQRKTRSAARRPPVPQASSTNYGERLYQRGVKKREEKEMIVRQARSEQHRQEVEHSFKPVTNHRGQGCRDLPTEDLLINYGKRRDEIVNFQRAMKVHQEVQDCKFKPKISKKSEQIVRNRSQLLEQASGRSDGSRRSTQKFDSLYQDAMRRNERQTNIYSACLDSECTFQPDVEKSKFGKRRFSSGSAQRNEQRNRENLFERLSQGVQSSRERSQMCMANSQTLTNDLYDPETGQEFFKPKIGRGPRSYQRPKTGNTHEHLYEAGRARSVRKQFSKVEAEAKKVAQANKKFTTNSTKRIVEKKKIESFHQIFMWLDSDNDGQISAEKIDISLIPADLLEVLSPLFCEMDELCQALDAEEFIDAVGRLYDSVTVPERNVLMLKPDQRQRSSSNRRKHDPGYEYKPKINSRSRKIADRKNQGTNKDVAERLYSQQKRLQSNGSEKNLFHGQPNAQGYITDLQQHNNLNTLNAFANPQKQRNQQQYNPLPQIKKYQSGASSNNSPAKQAVPFGDASHPQINQIQMFGSGYPHQQQQLFQTHPVEQQNMPLQFDQQPKGMNPNQFSPSEIQQQLVSQQLENQPPMQKPADAGNGAQGVDLNNLAHIIASEMLQKHLNQQSQTQNNSAQMQALQNTNTAIDVDQMVPSEGQLNESMQMATTLQMQQQQQQFQSQPGPNFPRQMAGPTNFAQQSLPQNQFLAQAMQRHQ